ncbi:hypothetical protein TIFTF001_022593 [Ficus carica]|uniref:Uncharacterized protein n=1 Tax=Ficus carica TaxID=3494 RepID=A0AA88DBU5_FICCA|nr:hypothetical protein TIFTF001_022593 [Ficus carica]
MAFSLFTHTTGFTQLITSSAKSKMEYDRKAEFDELKTGVKGLLESGVTRIPRIFIQDQKKLNEYSSASEVSKFSIPIIDLEDVNKCANRRDQPWSSIKRFGLIDGVRRFHELDSEVRKKFYTLDESRKVSYNTSFDFYQAPAANWRDSLSSDIAPSPPSAEELPQVCR